MRIAHRTLTRRGPIVNRRANRAPNVLHTLKVRQREQLACIRAGIRSRHRNTILDTKPEKRWQSVEHAVGNISVLTAIEVTIQLLHCRLVAEDLRQLVCRRVQWSRRNAANRRGASKHPQQRLPISM